jgi:hypothetical protein
VKKSKFLIIFFFLFQSYAYAQDFIVIVNRNGPLAGANMEFVRQVYLGEKRFADSTKLLPVNFTEGPLKDAFLKTIIGMSPKEYKHHCINKLFLEGLSITLMDTPVDIVEFVGKEKGAVAYLPVSWAESIRSGTLWYRPLQSETLGSVTLNGTEDIKIIGP